MVSFQNCGLENLFYLVEGSPKELKGNPGPEVESFLQVHTTQWLSSVIKSKQSNHCDW